MEVIHMKNEILIPKNCSFTEHLTNSLEKYSDGNKTETALRSLPQNTTTEALIHEQVGLNAFQLGYILGQLLAWFDTLPDELAKTQKLADLPVDILVKLKIDELVLKNLDDYHQKVTSYKEYWERYRRLSETICGYGYNMYFIEDRYHSYFPNGSHHVVDGFANGYSTGFHTICEESGVTVERTHPIHQDIWKNWPFFVDPGCHEYRLDGKFLFMYHGGWNCTPDHDIPYGNNVKMVNEGIYQALKNRACDFEPFNINLF